MKCSIPPLLFVVSLFALPLSASAEVEPWGLKNGTTISGEILRIDPPGQAVIKTSSGIINLSLHDFDAPSLDRIKTQFASLDIGEILDQLKPKADRPPRKISGWDSLKSNEQIGLLWIGAAVVLGLVSYFWLLVVAFKENPLWGIAILLFAIAELVFFVLHFKKSIMPILLLLGCILFAAIGYMQLIQS